MIVDTESATDGDRTRNRRSISIAINTFLIASDTCERRRMLGGFKRSSQHLDEGCCDEDSKATFGSIWAGAIAVTWPAAGGGTR